MYYISEEGYLVRKTTKLSSLFEDVDAGVLKFGYKDAKDHKSMARVLALAVGPSPQGNQLLYGLNLNKLSDEQEQILAKYLPDILKYDSPKKRYKALKYHPIISKMIPHLLDDYSEPSENSLEGGAYATWRLDRMKDVKYVTTDLKSYVEPTPDEISTLSYMAKPTLPDHDRIEPVYKYPTIKDVEPKELPQPVSRQFVPHKQPVPVTAPTQMQPIEKIDDYTSTSPEPVVAPTDTIKQTPAMGRFMKSMQKPQPVQAPDRPIDNQKKKPEPVLSPISRPQRADSGKVEEIDSI